MSITVNSDIAKGFAFADQHASTHPSTFRRRIMHFSCALNGRHLYVKLLSSPNMFTKPVLCRVQTSFSPLPLVQISRLVRLHCSFIIKRLGIFYGDLLLKPKNVHCTFKYPRNQ